MTKPAQNKKPRPAQTQAQQPAGLSALSNSIRRWTIWFILASIFAVACWFLSQWQLARLNEVREVISRIEVNSATAPVELASLIKNTDDFDRANEYRRVIVTGVYQSDLTALVRNRPRNGQPGFEMFVPIKLANGKYVIVDRGWLATGSKQDLPDNLKLATTEPISIVAQLRFSQPDSGRNYERARSGTSGELGNSASAIDVYQMGSPSALEAARVMRLPASNVYSGFYLSLVSEALVSGDQLNKDESLVSLGRPEVTEGNHLSYAFQWILFALMAFFAIGWAIRQELLHRRSESDPNFVVKKRNAVGSTDAAVEDAALDSDGAARTN